MVHKKDTTMGHTKEFDAQIQVLDLPNEINTAYSPIGVVRCGRSVCRIPKLEHKLAGFRRIRKIKIVGGIPVDKKTMRQHIQHHLLYTKIRWNLIC